MHFTLSTTIEKLANGCIAPNLKKFLDPSETYCARPYGTPKIHKEETSLRIMISLIGSPTYKLFKWLFSKLKEVAAEPVVTEGTTGERDSGMQ